MYQSLFHPFIHLGVLRREQQRVHGRVPLSDPVRQLHVFARWVARRLASRGGLHRCDTKGGLSEADAERGVVCGRGISEADAERGVVCGRGLSEADADAPP
jgi:hypothetical protein